MRYAAVRIADDSSLTFSSNLWNLEILIVKGMGGRVSLPETLWEMVKVRHLHVYNRGIFTRPNGLLNELRTLASVWFYSAEDANNILAKTPNLQKLRCQVSASHGSSPAFNNLTKLEMLKLSGDFSSVSDEMILPPTLKKLTLFDGCVASFNQVATLPNLVVLKLLNIRILYNAWKVTDGEFPHLKFLKLQDLSLSEWNVSDDAFPCLEHLVLRRLRRLEEIPPCFADMLTLKSIQVIGCKESLVESARDIRETQVEEMQNCGFALLIQKY